MNWTVKQPSRNSVVARAVWPIRSSGVASVTHHARLLCGQHQRIVLFIMANWKKNKKKNGSCVGFKRPKVKAQCYGNALQYARNVHTHTINWIYTKTSTFSNCCRGKKKDWWKKYFLNICSVMAIPRVSIVLCLNWKVPKLRVGSRQFRNLS